MGQYRAVRRQQREPLVNHAMSRTELPDLAVPTATGVASILDETRPHAGVFAQVVQLVERHVADAEHSGLSTPMYGFHRPPGLPVVGDQAVPLSGTVQQVRIDIVRAQMFE